MIKFSTLLLLLTQCLLFRGAYAQFQTENASDRKEMAAAVDAYYKSLGSGAGLYNGVLYTGHARIIKEGHPFFETTEPIIGNVYYDGMLYKRTPLRYDIIKDQILSAAPQGIDWIVLHPQKVNYFELDGHHFIRVVKDSSDASSLPTGYYDQIYAGKSQVLVKRTKIYNEVISREGIWYNIFRQVNDRFLIHDGKYFRLGSAGSVLKALGAYQQQIQGYLKANKVKFKANPEKATVMMVQYFDQQEAVK